MRSAASGGTRPTRILIVEDSGTVREQIRRALVPAGFDVIEATDGAEGLQKASEHPDLAMLISDVNMPRMGGIEMLQRMRAAGIGIPALMLTSEGEPELIFAAKAAGARGWIVKPFDEALLVRAVRSLSGG